MCLCMQDGSPKYSTLMVLDFLSSLPVCGAFSLFTFNVNIVMCEFNPAILFLVGCFALRLAQFLHCILGLYHLVLFCSGWYWLFLSMFSASFRSSCKAGLVVTKSLSNGLSVKDFISPSLMKLSLA